MSRKTTRNRRRRNAKINRLAGWLDVRFGNRRYGLEDALDFLNGRENYAQLAVVDVTRTTRRENATVGRRFKAVVGPYFFNTFEQAEAFRRTNMFFWDHVELSDESGILMTDTDIIDFDLIAVFGVLATRLATRTRR